MEEGHFGTSQTSLQAEELQKLLLIDKLEVKSK